MKQILGVLGLCLCLGACSNAAKIAAVPESEGAARAFDAPPEKVREVAIDSLRQTGMIIQEVEDGSEAIRILFTRPVRMTWGGVGRVLIERTIPVTVRLVYERRVGPNLGGYDSAYARNYFALFYPALGLQPPPKSPG